MSDASRDENFVTTLLAVSSVDGVTPVTLYANPTTHRLLVDLASGMTNPMTTGGDIIYGGIAGVPTRLPNGTAGQVLTSNGTTLAPSWTAAGSGTVTNVSSANADIGVATGTTTPVLTLNSATLSTASTIVKRDVGANTYSNNYFANTASTVSAAGTTVLTIASARTQNLTGASTQTFQLPDATTLPLSSIFEFNNNSSNSLIITNAGATTQYTVPPGGAVKCFCTNIGSANGSWDFHALAPSSVTWSSGITGLVMNSVLTTSPSVASGASSATVPAFLPQRGSTTTGYSGDSTNLYGVISGATAFTATATNFTAPAINKVAITAPATAATLTILNNKTFTVNNTLTLAGTDGTTMTFPTTTATLARTDASNTFTGASTASAWVLTSPTITTSIVPTSNDGAALGSTSNQFSDLFLAEGAVINWDNGDMTMTQTSNVLTIAGGNVLNNNFVSGFTTTATAAGTTVLTVDSTKNQFFTGATTQTITLPVVTTLSNGHQFYIVNLSSGLVTINTSGGNQLSILAGGVSTVITCKDIAGGTGTASWTSDPLAIIVTAGKKITVSNTLTFAGTDNTTMTFPGSSDTVAGLAATQTLTNKRVTLRTGTTTSSATPTINTDNVDFYSITAQTVDITSFTTNLSGTPTEGQKLQIAITGTAARAITWGASFEASTVALPTTTVTTARLDVGFIWNTVTSKWRCLASA